MMAEPDTGLSYKPKGPCSTPDALADVASNAVIGTAMPSPWSGSEAPFVQAGCLQVDLGYPVADLAQILRFEVDIWNILWQGGHAWPVVATSEGGVTRHTKKRGG
jgi:hypothetical protein